MKWTEYLRFEFKKPEETDPIKALRDKKKRFQEELNKCYSRLETIEICTSNSKLDDAILLMRYLKKDIYNLLLIHGGESPVASLEDPTTFQLKIKDSELYALFSKLHSELDLENPDEDKTLKNESVLSETLYEIEKKTKSGFENPIDNFKTRLQVQSIIIMILVILGGGTGLKKYIDTRPLNKDTFTLNTSEDKNQLPSPETEITLPVNPENDWETLRFEISPPRNLESIHLNPIHQNKARIQFKDLKVFDDKGNIILQKDLKIENLDITYLLKFIKTEEIYPGKIGVGRSLEIESTGTNPKLIITPENKLEKVSAIEITTRATKRVNQFRD